MIELTISQGYIALLSDEDIDLANFKWWANRKHKGSAKVYVARREIGSGKMTQMHRVVLSRMTGRPLEKHEICDHIDGNPLNNQRSNLRLCTSSQNNCNSGVCVDSESGYTGVCLDDRRGTYFAYLDLGKKRLYLGSGFKDPIEAAKVRDRKAIEIHGEFAHLNFDRSDYEQESSS